MKYSKDGYKRTSKDKNNPYNVIPSGNITMEGVDFPVFGMDNLGNSRVMMPGANYTFPGSSVFEVPMQKGGSVSWQWKGKTYSGTLIPSMETATNRYARTKNGKIKTLPKAQDGSMFDLKGYFRGEQGLIPDLYGKTTKQTYKENKDNVQKGLDVVSATGIPFVSQAANLGSSAIDFGDAYSAYKSGDMDTYNQELAKATTNVTLGMVPGVKQAKLIKNVAQGVGENIVKTGINTGTKYAAKKGIKSGVDEAVDAISGKSMFGGEVYRYERSPFKNGKFVISNPADLIIEITKTEVFTPEFKMGGSVKMNEFNLEKKFDKDKKLPYIEYTGEPDIEGRVYYDDETNEIVDVTTLELRKKRKHDRIKMIIDKYESDMELSSAEKEALNSLGLLD